MDNIKTMISDFILSLNIDKYVDDILTQIISIVFNPQFFGNFLIAIAALSLIAILVNIIQSAMQARAFERTRRAERESLYKEFSGYKDKNNELVSTVDNLKKELGTREQDILEATKVKEELKRREVALKSELSDKEKLSSELKDFQVRLFSLQNDLKSSRVELDAKSKALDKLKEELNQKTESLRNATLVKDKLEAGLKDKDAQLAKVQDEFKYSKEVCQGLKEQYSDLERQADALKQQLALEKVLYQKLKDGHQGSKGSASASIQPPAQQ